MEPGIHLIHKPVGATSFSLVQAFMAEVAAQGLRKKQMPLCHGGALDPFAEGLLLILAGQATRLMELLHPIPKDYLAEVVWGAETDNGDLLGRVVFAGDTKALSPEALDALLPGQLGFHDQVPPATSNKRIDGERAYLKAHRGETVVLPPSRVFLQSARFLDHDLPRRSRLQISCRGGYYVRSLARDLGRALGCGAHLAKLQRTAIGPWRDPGPGQRLRLHGSALLPWCASRALGESEAAELRGGRPIPVGEVRPGEWALPPGFPDPLGPVRGLQGSQLVALLREREGQLWTFANLRGGL